MNATTLLENLNQLNEIPPDEWPDKARDMIFRGLHDTNTETRLAATNLAWPILDQAIADRLLEIVQSDPDEEVRSRAAICFGPVFEDWDMFGDDLTVVSLKENTVERVRESFKRIYDDPSQPKLVRRRVLEASVRAPESWHEEATEKAFRSNDEDWRVTAIFCMGFVPGFGDTVLDMLKNGKGDMRDEAVKSAGQLGLSEAVPYLNKLILNDKTKKDLRIEALFALSAIADEDSAEIFATMMDHSDDELAEAAADAFADYQENCGYDMDDDLDEEDWDEESDPGDDDKN